MLWVTYIPSKGRSYWGTENDPMRSRGGDVWYHSSSGDYQRKLKANQLRLAVA